MASHHSFCAAGPLRIVLRTKILYELAETRCIERIEGIIQSFDLVRVSTMSRQIRKFVRIVEQKLVMDDTLTELSKRFHLGDNRYF
jgi:hypothetical protein